LPLSFTPILRQPTSTLFPYTTLFRSPIVRATAREHRAGGSLGIVHHRPELVEHERLPEAPDSLLGEDYRPARRELDNQRNEHQRDRKSTRLNSSHRTISYAVFCLKKK